MPTLMTTGPTGTFGELAKIRSALDAGPFAPGPTGRLAGIFVPWAGSRLEREGGIYYVGMATHGAYGADIPQTTFDAQLALAESLCTNRRDHLAHTPFWQFLDGLTWALLGAPSAETSDRWGWSNLLKIGWSEGAPNDWRKEMKDAQQDICAVALRKEIERLHHSLVVIVSFSPLNVLDSDKVFPQLIQNWNMDYESNWKKDYHEQTGLWWFNDQKSGNLYVHGHHPRPAVYGGYWGSALGRTIQLARASMPRFARSVKGRRKVRHFP